MKSVLVTGVSTGIGSATAQYLIEKDFRVFGTLRHERQMSELKERWGDTFVPLLCDLRDSGRIIELRPEIDAIIGPENLYGIVNNAGISLLGPVVYQAPEELQEQFDVNVMGPLRLIQALFPLLGGEAGRRGPPGRIINVTSVSGRQVLPFMGSYAASKHALEALSDALRRELQDFGIDTIVVEPGAILTPLWRKTTEDAVEPYKDTPLAKQFARFVKMFAERGANDGLPAEKVAAVIHKALTARRPKARYAVMKYPVRDFLIPGLMPERMVDAMIRKQLSREDRP